MPEPPPAAAFMGAFARGDEAGAESLASPICRCELATRSRGSAPARLVPDVVPASARPWAAFDYAGGAADGYGFGHLLYVGQPLGGNGVGAPAVWRADTAPSGKVIWIELVWLFTLPDHPVAANVARELDPATFPAGLASLQPRALLGVRSPVAREAYYLATARVDGVARVLFFAVDSDGQFRPGVWSFGAPPSAPNAPGEPSTSTLTAEQDRILQAYLQAIG
jgi:hypothetical protein